MLSLSLIKFLHCPVHADVPDSPLLWNATKRCTPRGTSSTPLASRQTTSSPTHQPHRIDETQCISRRIFHSSRLDNRRTITRTPFRKKLNWSWTNVKSWGKWTKWLFETYVLLEVDRRALEESSHKLVRIPGYRVRTVKKCKPFVKILDAKCRIRKNTYIIKGLCLLD